MTRPTDLSGTAGPLDAELAVRAGAGDSAALGAIFDRYAPHLLAFCRGMLRTTVDAEDCLQDVFVIAARRLAGLREPERLRSWLFAVARHECLARIAKSKKEVPVDALPEAAMVDPDQPANAALDVELSQLLAAAIAGLSERDRVVLELADRHGLPTDDVAVVVGMSPASTLRLLSRARTTARRSIGALLVARTGRDECPELDAMLTGWTGLLTPLLRKRIARHIEECSICGERERRMATPAALLGAAPIPAVPFALRSRVLDAATGPMASGATGGWHDDWPAGSRVVRRSGYVTAGIAVAVVVAILIGIFSVSYPWRRPVAATSGVFTSVTVAPSGTPRPTAAPPSPRGSQSTTAPTTTRPGQTTTPPRSGTAPVIDVMTVSCAYAPDGSYLPELHWVSRRDTGIALSIDNPGIVGSYGQYDPSGTITLPPNGCDPSQGQQIYTITTVGGTGPAATRTIRWDPPTNRPPPPPSPSSSSTAVVIE